MSRRKVQSLHWLLVLLAGAAGSCAMDREQLLDGKLCDDQGNCARGFTCVDGECRLADDEDDEPVAKDAGNGNEPEHP